MGVRAASAIWHLVLSSRSQYERSLHHHQADSLQSAIPIGPPESWWILHDLANKFHQNVFKRLRASLCANKCETMRIDMGIVLIIQER